MNDIQLFGEWGAVKNSIDKCNQFRYAIDYIKRLDPSNDINCWLKWKNYNNQVVIKTPNFYYKVYVDDLEHGTFSSYIREELAKLYRGFGLLWNIVTINDNNVLYMIEQREPIKQCTSTDIDYEQLLLNWGSTLKLLEESLGLNIVLKQVQEIVPEAKQLKLIRDCFSKYDDYGIINGKIVLFDDADWFLCLVDGDGNVLPIKNNVIEVLTKFGDFKFASIHHNPNSMPVRVNEVIDQWWLFLPRLGNQKSMIDFRNQRKCMLDASIKLLSTMKSLPDAERGMLLPLDTKILIPGDSNER